MFVPTHVNRATGARVKATHWQKDGDHPQVVRYPIERRAFKGLLVVNEKSKVALHFNDWIVEDEKGRAFAVAPEVFPEAYNPLDTAEAA